MRATNKLMNGKRTRALYDLGFAIHWLKPRSKMPVELKWTTGPRKKWPELQSHYRRGMNVGVRLGSPSKVGDGYLAVIDCDVKGGEDEHAREMLQTLRDLIGVEVLKAAPKVRSGRGNGSRHFYVLTKEPASPRRLSQSSEKVKVHMPSAKEPSRYEIENLTAAELKAGIRIRPAWEISLMGEGQQTVLPPSIHPDTGGEYEWDGTPDFERIPFLKVEAKEAIDRGEKIQDFKAVTVDLVGSKLPDYVVDQILSGDGVGDRSASLLGAANSMLRAGFTDQEILSVLTDPEHYLGAVAYEHAQTKKRSRAAEWVRKYTLEKSKREVLAQYQFDEEVEVEKLSEEEAQAQKADLVREVSADFRDQLERGGEESGYRPKNTLKNVLLILQGAGGKDIFKRDEFANAELYGQAPPWGKGRVGEEITDIDTFRIKDWIAKEFRFEPSNDRINEAISIIADQNRYHPVRDYLKGLKWDGVERIDTWLKDYCNATAPEPYLSAISRKVLVAMVKRIYEPGCKFDHVLILENEKQGIGKSTAVRMLAGDSWFTDQKINIADKDAVLTMRSVWVVELGELSAMRKADVDDLKEFVSRKTDRIRVPYGKRSENFPRQCVFIGTTNSKEYLKDPTGNRRFWPVAVGACDFERIAKDRDQLFAEARFAYELGEPLYLEDPKMVAGAVKEQEARQTEDTWEETISEWLAGKGTDAEEDGGVSRERFSLNDLFGDFGPLNAWKANRPELLRAAEALRKLGFAKCERKIDGRTRKVWERRK